MKRFLFLVQGEGRGHLTQALSLAQLLRRSGHEVVAVLVGTADGRPVPDFFRSAIHAPIGTFLSPALVYHPLTQAFDLRATALNVVRRCRTYWRSLNTIHRLIEQHQPDAVVNFYEVLGGLAYAFRRPGAPMICVGHQYLMLHPAFVFPKNRRLDRWLVNFNTFLTSIGAEQRLALSFRPMSDRPTRRLTVVPPLLRQEVQRLHPSRRPYLLAYLTQPGLREQLIRAHRQHPEVEIRLFMAGVEQPVVPYDETLSFHRIDGQAYLSQMEHCAAVVTTAGFESVCEAMYLGKPVLMIPVPGHFEQACNAIDGQSAGAGIAAEQFDLSLLLRYLATASASPTEDFRAWHSRGTSLIVRTLEAIGEPSRAQPAFPVFSVNYLRQKLAFR